MLPPEVIYEAEREVRVAQSHGLLYSPEEAWAVPGNRKVETLWSIALRVAIAWDVSAEELCEVLEHSFRHGRYHKGWHESKSDDLDSSSL